MEIFKYIIPAFIVMMTAYLLLDKMFNNEEKKRQHEINRGLQKSITPTRLRAYERLTLLIERSHPSNMLVTLIQPGMTCMELQTKILQSLRQEFEHNVSQQIYVSDELWDAVKATHENLIKLVHTAATHFQADEPATILAESIIRIYSDIDPNPSSVAMELLKNETRTQFLNA